MKFRILWTLLALIAVIVGVAVGVKESDWNINTRVVHTRPFAPRIVWQESPQTQATLLWCSMQSLTEPATVYWDTVSRQGVIEEYEKSSRVRRGTLLPTSESFRWIDQFEMWSHQLVWTELQPDTTYYFAIEQQGEISREYHFTTAPDENRPLSLLYGADSRSGWEQRRIVNQQLARTIAADDSILAFCHGGDFVGEGIYLDHWYHWLADYELMIPPSGKLLPIVPARGNHDKGKLYNMLFGWEASDPNYYSLAIRPNLKLMTLNCNLSYAGQQLDWMNRTLDSYSLEDWVIVQYHLPAFPAVKRSGPARQYWVRHWEQKGVDLACEADGHCMKRTAPLIQGSPHPDGIVYVGEGGLGVKQRTPLSENRSWMTDAFTGSGHHFHQLHFDAENAWVETISWTGQVLDTYQLKQRLRGGMPQLATEKAETKRQ